MKILVTGGNGQLGQDMIQLLKEKGYDVIVSTRKEMDVTDPISCSNFINKHNPNCIIHCAAYTSVDDAENFEDIAYRVNAMGTRNLAVAAERIMASLVYISTDYVFDGRKTEPYREYDNTNPINVYGKSKQAGEILVQSLSSKYFIVRTQWLYGISGKNFVKTILKNMQNSQEIKVVNDQIGSPTYTIDLANFIVALIQSDNYGIYHASNTGSCTWYQFAEVIMQQAEKLLGIKVNAELLPCTSNDLSRLALRPRNSVLEHVSIRANGFRDFRPWNEALRDFFEKVP